MQNIIQERKKSKKGFQITDWPESFLEKISCPLCNSANSTPLYPHAYRRLVSCDSCDLVYTSPRLKKKYLKHLYSEEYFNNNESVHFGYENYLADEEKIVTTFKKRVKEIEKIATKGKLLDVGCATGFFMKAAYDEGWKVEGNEISEFAASYAKNHFKFNVIQEDFLKAKLPANSFNVVTMWDVIEHFYDPLQAIQKTHKLLKDDGTLVISTPDVSSLPAKLTKDKWVGYKLSDEHLTYFSKDTIKKLLNESGFTIKKIHYIGKHVSVPMLSDRASIYNPLLGRLIKSTTKILPSNYFLYVNPFDIMCVYAQKNSNK